MSLSPRSVEKSAQRLVECPRLLVRVAHGVQTLPPRALRAMDAVASVQLSATTMTRFGAGCWAPSESSVAPMEAASLWAGMRTVTVTGPPKTPRVSAITSLGASNFTCGIGRAPGSVHDHPFDEGHAGGEDQTETDGTDHDGEGGRLGVVDDVPSAEQCPGLRGLIERGRACRHCEPQQERSTDGDACDDQSDVAAEPAAGITAPGGPDIVVARSGARRSLSAQQQHHERG